MSSFNFDKFDTEFEMRQILRKVTDTLTSLRTPDDERLIPMEPGTPLHDLLESLQVGTAEAPPAFDFELGEMITIEEAGRRCQERVGADGRIEPVNLPEMLVTAGQRVFFNTAMRLPATYVEISRPEASDLGSEVSVCHFLDGPKTVIDWSESLPELKRLAKDRRYTTGMMKVALHRLVNRYCAEQSHLVSDLDANTMATYLLTIEKNRDKTAFRRKELYELTRKPEMDLRAPLAMARKLIDKIYDPERPELATQRLSLIHISEPTRPY